MENHIHGFLYQVTRARLEEEIQRFRNLEEKTAKYFGFLSGGIAIYTFFLSELALLIPPERLFPGMCRYCGGIDLCGHDFSVEPAVWDDQPDNNAACEVNDQDITFAIWTLSAAVLFTLIPV